MQVLPPSYSRLRSVLLSCLVLAPLSGCPENDEGFAFQLTKIDVPDCEGQKAGSRPALQSGEYTLRYTFLRRKPDNVTAANIRHNYTSVCWRVVPKGARAAFLLRRVGGEADPGPFTVIVEAFKDGKLAYVGRRENLAIKPNGQGTIFMRPTIEATETYQQKENELAKRGKSGALSSIGFSCLDPQRGPRAFHSATLLPNGQVLIYGGIAGASGAVLAGNQASALSSVEIFRPNYGEGQNQDFNFSVVPGTNLPARAFHHTVLLPSPAAGPYKLLVIGGIQPQNPKDTKTPVVNVGMSLKPFMFTPVPGTVAAPALLLTYSPAGQGSVQYEELQALPRAMFPAVATKGNLLALAGGAQQWSESGTPQFIGAKYLQFIELKDPPTVRTPAASMVNLRVFHDMAVLGEDGWIVVGGHMDGSDDDHAEYLPAGSSALSKVTFTVPDPTTTNMSTIAHTLTPIGTTDADLAAGTNPPVDALWAGGFVLGKLTAPQMVRETGPRPTPRPQDRAVHLVRNGTPPTAIQVITENAGTVLPGHFVTAGHHAALRLHNGSVLLTGGKLGNELQNCGVETPFCASNQVVIYDYTLGSVTPRASTLQGGRWQLFDARLGHRMTRLLDNSVLITGGISLKKDTSEGQVLLKAELFTPRSGDKTEDLLQRGPAREGDQAPAEEICEAWGDES